MSKRPTEELYDLKSDPYQVNNLAGDDIYYKVIESLRNKLISYLHKTGDPRFTDQVVNFNDYPYRAEYIDAGELDQLRKKQTEGKRVHPPFLR